MGLTMAIDHPHNIRKIAIQDFKSIGDAALDLSPMTLILGANSSGKSSLLQALLSVSQAARSQSPSNHYPLNGDYARFGTFSETARFQSTASAPRVTIGILVVDQEKHAVRAARRGRQVAEDASPPLIEWQFHMESPDEKTLGYALITEASFSLKEGPIVANTDSIVVCQLNSIHETTKSKDGTSRPILRSRYMYHGDDTSIAETQGFVKFRNSESDLPIECHAVEFEGCLPRALYRRCSVTEAVARDWWRTARQNVGRAGRERQTAETSADAADKSPQDHSELLSKYLEYARNTIERFYADSFGNDSGRPLIRGLSFDLMGLLQAQLNALGDELGATQIQHVFELLDMDTFVQRLLLDMKDHPANSAEVLDSIDEYNEDLFWSIHELQMSLAHRIKYLGPLRKAPQVVYDPRQQQLDLGVSGEYTAAVLHASLERQVEAFDRDGTVTDQALGTAVNYWLHELGLARRAHLEDRGRLGIGLQLTPMDSNERVDLTSVGVGVSQILPVIVLCLSARPGDLVILEQPELHLHPALQQKLGDFLLACVVSGRQLLVESHSEHLVNRIRRRAAEWPSWPDELVSLIFAEQVDGTTSYRTSEIDSLGQVEADWPLGFFDLSSAEARALVAASVARRAMAP